MSNDQLKTVANQLRKRVLEMCFANGGHISTSYSCVEILVTLYFSGVMRLDPKDPKLSSRDKFILSKGHGETILYATLAERGYFPKEWLTTRYRAGDCILGGHVDSKVPGVEVTTGALGHGLGVGCGIALAAKMDNLDNLHYVLLGDAECSEGSIWEAALFASQHQLGNLVAIIDLNGIGSLDYTKNYIALESMAEKWHAFGWNVLEVDGHNYVQLIEVLTLDRLNPIKKPTAVIAKTIKGKGVTAFEDDPVWHVKPVTAEYLEMGLKELELGD